MALSGGWVEMRVSKDVSTVQRFLWMPENGNGRAMHVTIESHVVPLTARPFG